MNAFEEEEEEKESDMMVNLIDGTSLDVVFIGLHVLCIAPHHKHRGFTLPIGARFERVL